jgi:hypothetical protein
MSIFETTTPKGSRSSEQETHLPENRKIIRKQFSLEYFFGTQSSEEKNLQIHAKPWKLGTNYLNLGISSKKFPIFGHFV